MRTPQGGTQIWCPECKKITICKGVNPSKFAIQSGQCFYKSDHTDIQWFRRGRVCLDCEHEFLTAELNEKFLDELVELREALAEITQHAETYTKESQAATKSLGKLTESLNVLKALKIYQQA